MSLNVHSPLVRWLGSLVTIGGNALVQAITLFIFANWFGPAEYSILVISAASAMVAAELVGLGAGDLLVRDVSRNPAAFGILFGKALWIVGLTFLPIAIVASLIASSFLPATPLMTVFILVASEILAVRIVALAEQISISQGDIHKANACRWIGVAIRLAAVCAAVFVGHVSDVRGWSLYTAGSAALTMLVCLILCIRWFGEPHLTSGPGRWRDIGVTFSLLQLIRAAQYAIDKLVVAMVAQPATVGAYGVASRAAQLGVTPSSAITRMMYPTFFKKGRRGVKPAVRLALRLARSVVGVALLSAAGLAAGAYALPIVLGPSYVEAKVFLLIMTLLPVAASLQNLAGSVLSGADLQGRRVWSSAGGLFLTAGVSLLGAATAGPIGAAMGYVSGHFLAALLMIAAIMLPRHNGLALRRGGIRDVRSVSLD